MAVQEQDALRARAAHLEAVAADSEGRAAVAEKGAINAEERCSKQCQDLQGVSQLLSTSKASAQGPFTCSV